MGGADSPTDFSGSPLDVVMFCCFDVVMQRFTVALEDGVADGLRVEAARARVSVAELIRRRVVLPAVPSRVVVPADGAGGGEPSDGLRTGDTSASTGIVAGAPVGPSSPPSGSKRKGLCEHRVPAEQFCKRCDP